MTIGIARRFGRRVLIVTDTMITDSMVGRANAIPGRLKAIVLSPWVSVAYAGHSDPAVHAIRRARQRLLVTGDLSILAQDLLETASNGDHDVEFLLVHHSNGSPGIRKITAGGITNDLQDAFIGDASIVARVLRMKLPQTAGGYPDLEIEREELEFWYAFKELFLSSGTSISAGVGGLPIGLVASPYGHFYTNFGISMAWDAVDLRLGITPQENRAQRSGETAWSFNVSGCDLRGVAALGIALPQAGVGFVHSPLTADEAERIEIGVPRADGDVDTIRLLEAVRMRLDSVQVSIGGGVDELDDPRRGHSTFS